MDQTLSALPAQVGIDLGQSLEAAAVAIGRLDARVSASSLKVGWLNRAGWAGYTRALQLQGSEIDEIDVFSAVSGLPLPSRRRRASHAEEFGALVVWLARVTIETGPEWRDRLPFPLQAPISGPILWRALSILHRYSRHDRGIEPWLAVPFLLRGLGLTRSTLPCLVAGAKAFRFRATLTEDVIGPVVRSLTSAADTGLQRLEAMERDHRAWIKALASEYRASALHRLAALISVRPLLSPQSVADALGLTLGGAGKLLTRASELSLIVEITGRRAWRLYLSPDVALAYGYLKAPRGRPSRPADEAFPDRSLTEALETFDREMAEITARLGELGIPSQE